MTAVTAKQISAIHVLAKKAGLDEDLRRDMLQRETGKRSSRELTSDEAVKVIQHLRLVAENDVERAAHLPSEGALRLTGPFAGICRTLWICGWNLGVVDDRTDKALVAFVRRQTGIDHLNWLRDKRDAEKVIEALKSWISRGSFIDWSPSAATLKKHGVTLTRWRKTAVITAQYSRLSRQGKGTVWTTDHLTSMTDAELDKLSSDLGKRIRAPRE